MNTSKCGFRRRRHAFYAAVFVAAASLLTLAANIGAVSFWKDLCVDTSKEQYTVLADETKDILAALNQDIYLYYIGSTELDDLRVTQLLKRYAAFSPRVHYRRVDPSIHTGFTQLYDPQQTGIEKGSVIVSDSDGFLGDAPGRFDVLSKDDLYMTSAAYYDESGKLVSDYQYFRAQQKITSAMTFVVTDQRLRAVFLSGEKTPCGSLIADLSGLFYEAQTSDLSDISLNPLSDTLIVISPQNDLSEDTYKRIMTFLGEGGKGIFFIDSVNKSANKNDETEWTRFDSLLFDFGLKAQRNVIVGTDPAHTYMSRMSLVPLLSQSSQITKPLIEKNQTPVFSYAGAIIVSETDGVSTDVLLTTDISSYAKTAEDTLDTCSLKPGDASGPFVIGVLAQKGNAALALFSSASPIITEQGYGIPGNRWLFLNTLGYINGRHENAIIPMQTVYSASDNAYKLNISSDFERVFYIGFTAVALPLIVLIIGISNGYRRRHR